MMPQKPSNMLVMFSFCDEVLVGPGPRGRKVLSVVESQQDPLVESLDDDREGDGQEFREVGAAEAQSRHTPSTTTEKANAMVRRYMM